MYWKDGNKENEAEIGPFFLKKVDGLYFAAQKNIYFEVTLRIHNRYLISASRTGRYRKLEWTLNLYCKQKA